MIDPRTSLAMAIHSNPGVYALLLGSGLSRSASIPTGWEIVEDMIRRVATASGKDCGQEPDTWYRNTFGDEPTYGRLLEAAGKGQAERSRLLRMYFEPSKQELERGDKQPTQAHAAISRLVKRGSVRVILTTNFDRLMERALEAEGVAPTVVSTPEAIEGAPPMAHCNCTLVKLHGDYMDLRTKNTPAELSSYDARIDSLLNRILDEYGLVVCGWSGDWDEALRKAIERHKARRFSMWWTSLGEPSEVGKRLAELCQAEVIPIQGADEFFEDLAERLDALDEFDRPHPVSTKLAVTLAKKYISEPKYRIQLHDLLMDEANRIADELSSERFPLNGLFSDDDYAHRILAFDALSETALHILATGCYWDEQLENMETWLKTIMRVANAHGDRGGNVGMLSLARHPARLMQYAAGIALVARDNLAGLHQLLSAAQVRQHSECTPLALALTAQSCWQDVFKRLPGFEQRKVPVSDHTYDVLRPAFRDTLPDDTEYKSVFDTLEVMQAFYSADISEWAIPSAFMYRTLRDAASPLPRLVQQVSEQKEDSPFLAAGFCKGSMERFETAKQNVLKMKAYVERR